MLKLPRPSIGQFLLRWLNTTLLFPHADRAVLYDMLAIQLRADVPVHASVDSLLNLSGNEGIVAKSCASALENKDSLGQGLYDSALIPLFEAQCVDAAESKGPDAMIEILGHLGTAKTRSSLLHSVIFENKYYGTLLLLILLMLYLAEGTMTQFVAQAPAVAEVSMAGVIFFIHHNGVWLATLLVIVIAMLCFSRTQHYGLRRKYLGPFDGDYRRAVAIEFCDMAQIIFRYESSQRRAMEICKSTLSGGYARSAMDAALARIDAQDSLAGALDGTLLDGDAARLFRVMVPAGNLDAYPAAFVGVAGFMEAHNLRYYKRALRAFSMLSLAAFLSLLLMVFSGLFKIMTIISGGV